jgi:hypothetical protein
MPITWKNITPVGGVAEIAKTQGELVDKFTKTIQKAGEFLDPSERQDQVIEAEGVRSLQRGVKELQSKEGLEELRGAKDQYSDAALQASNPFLTEAQRATLGKAAGDELTAERDLVTDAAMKLSRDVATKSLDVGAAKLDLTQRLLDANMSPAEVEARVAKFDASGVLQASITKTKEDFTDLQLRKAEAVDTPEDLLAQANQFADDPRFIQEKFMKAGRQRIEDKHAGENYIKTQATNKAYDDAMSQLMAGVDPDSVFNAINSNPAYKTIDKGAAMTHITNMNNALADKTPQERQAIAEYKSNATAFAQKTSQKNAQLVADIQGTLDATNPIATTTDEAIVRLGVDGSNPLKNIREIMTDGINSPGLKHVNDAADTLKADPDISLAEEQQIIQEAWIRTNRNYIRGDGVNEDFGDEVKVLADRVKKRKALTAQLKAAQDAVANADLAIALDIDNKALKISGKQIAPGQHVINVADWDQTDVTPELMSAVEVLNRLTKEVDDFEKESNQKQLETNEKALKKELKTTATNPQAKAYQALSYDNSPTAAVSSGILDLNRKAGELVLEGVGKVVTPAAEGAAKLTEEIRKNAAKSGATKRMKANFDKATGR